MLKIQEQYGRDAVKRFFEIFKPVTGLDVSLLEKIQPTNQDQKHTSFVAAWSVATNSDLRPLFYRWNYPIDEAYYANILPKLSGMLK